MTWRQVLNIRHGRSEGVRLEHDRKVEESRILVTYLSHMINGTGETFESIYPTSFDKIGNKEIKEQTRNPLSIESFFKVLVSAFEVTKNE